MISFILNNELIETTLPSGVVLLDFIRKERRLTGTKEGCREGDCGACTVLVGELIDHEIKYKTVNSCLFPLGDAHLKHIVTIEGLNLNELNYLQEKFVYNGGTQCGFCTPGFIVSSVGYLLANQKYDLDSSIEFISGNICRCTGYAGIKRSLSETINYINSKLLENGELNKNHIEELVKIKFIPEYFLNIPERLKQLAKTKTEKEIALPLVSGGTDLYVQKWEDFVDKEIYLLSSKQELKGIKLIDKEIFIGSATTISEIEDSEIMNNSIPELKNYLKLFGSKQIRNRATIGGNIVNASPIADMVNILLVLNAKLHLIKENKHRVVYLRDFYKGYKEFDKRDNEIITAVSFNVPEKNYLFNFEKISRRTYLDIASVNSSFLCYLENGYIIKANLSAGGVAPIPLYLKNASSFLEGKELNSTNIFECINIALSEIAPISDARGSAEYKALLLRQLILAHFIKFFPDLVPVELITQ